MEAFEYTSRSTEPGHHGKHSVRLKRLADEASDENPEGIYGRYPRAYVNSSRNHNASKMHIG